MPSIGPTSSGASTPGRFPGWAVWAWLWASPRERCSRIFQDRRDSSACRCRISSHEWAILIAALIILIVGFVDDTRSIGPRVKLLGQALAVLTLYLGGIRIQTIDVLSLNLDLGQPEPRSSACWACPIDLALPSLVVTMLWFLGCMNVWNLIDGMDGLASGVGLLVSGTLTLVAIHNENVEVAILAVALAGSLAGFLLYNWHPACIFLGDSGAS